MTVTSYSFTPFAPFTQVTITSDLTGPTIFWYLDGVYYTRTTSLSLLVHLGEGDQAEIIAVDTTDPEAIKVGMPLSVKFLHRGEGERSRTVLAFNPR